MAGEGADPALSLLPTGRGVTLSLVPASSRPGPGRSTTVLGNDILRGLYAHRLLTTAQLHELYAPAMTLRWALESLSRLREAGQIGRVRVAGGRMHAWFLTPKGVAVTDNPGVEQRPYRITPALAAGPLQAHTLALNDVGLCFVRAARTTGDDCSPGWRNETVHHLGPGKKAEVLICDATLEYTVAGDDASAYLRRFVELDRLTYTADRLVGRLEAYARLANYAPGWRLYPQFPGVLLVMDNRHVKPAQYERRMDALEQLIPLSGTLARCEHFRLLATTLEKLTAVGPHAPIWWRPGSTVLVDVRGREVS